MSPALLAPGLASCSADVSEAAALPCTEAPLWVPLSRGRPQGPARLGVPRERDVFRPCLPRC